MKLGYTILYVQDVRATLAFYEKAFAFKTRFVVPTNDYGELEMGSSSGTTHATTLAFAAEDFVAQSVGADAFRRNRRDDAHAAGAEISFVTDGEGEDVQAAFQKAVDAGAAVVKGPAQKPWGQLVAYVRDCNGFLVEICSPMGGGGGGGGS